MHQPVQVQPAPRKRGLLPTVGLVSGAVVIVVGAIAAAWTQHPRSGSIPVAAAPPPTVYGAGGAALPVDRRPLAKAPTKGLNFGEAPALSTVLPGIEAYVEEARGHRFQRQVVVTPLADKAFLAELHKGSGSSAAAAAGLDGEDATLEALHLLPRHTDLAATLAAERDQNVAGFYDPVSKQLFVRGTTLNPLGQVVVAHELTHALDDQWFDLSRMQERATDSDQDQAIRSLIEGDARSVENRFRAALVPTESKLADAEEKAEFAPAAGAATPPTFLELDSSFPYEVGAMFVDHLRGHGGTVRLDAAFTQPPSSTLQILDPQGAFLHRVDPLPYLAGPPAVVVGRTVAQDSLGAFRLAALLSEQAPLELLHQTAVVEGWNGDQYVTTRSGNQACVRDTIETRDGAGADGLYSALTSWAATQSDASVTRLNNPQGLLLVSCVG